VDVGHSHLIEKSAIEGSYSPASVQWAQLEPGRFDVQYAVVDASPVQLSARTFNVGFTAELEVIPQKFVTRFCADERTRARWFGAPFDETSLGFTRSTVHISTETRGSFFGVTIDLAALQRLIPNAPDALAVQENAPDVQLIRDPIRARRLRTLVHQGLLSECTEQGPLIGRPSTKSIYGTIIPLLAAVVERVDHHSVEPTKCLNRRLRAVRACESYMREHVDATLTLLDLSQVSGMRSRSLINAFEAVTGFSPMDYLKRLRLNGVHRALGRADKLHTRIIDVATEWGFWHMGHFTSDYHAMFGETPSQTLLSA
jgi:AraC-like DNA-binding protein